MAWSLQKVESQALTTSVAFWLLLYHYDTSHWKKHYLTWWRWPLTLTFKLDLDIFPSDLHTKIQVRMSVYSPVRASTQTHRSCQTYYTRRDATHEISSCRSSGQISRSSSKIKVKGQGHQVKEHFRCVHVYSAEDMSSHLGGAAKWGRHKHHNMFPFLVRNNNTFDTIYKW